MKSVSLFKQVKNRSARLAPIAFSTAFLIAVPCNMASAQTAPTLGTAQTYAVLAGATVTNANSTLVIGDLGVSTGSAVTGSPEVVGGNIHPGDAAAAQAQLDSTTAYKALAAETCNTAYAVPTDLGGLTLTPGVYCFTSTAALTGNLTLDAQGDPNAVFIFQIGTALTTASNSSVVLTNDAQPCSVFWQVSSSATLGTGTDFVGNILAFSSISLNTSATISGRALAQTGAVTMLSNTVSIPSCPGPLTNAPPTLGTSFSPSTIAPGANSTLALTLGNSNSTADSVTGALTDTLPAGVVISGNASNTCGATLTAPAGGSTISLSGGSIPANGSCGVTVSVTATAASTYINSLTSGALQTSAGGNASPAVASLVAAALQAPAEVPPALGISFNPSPVAFRDVSTLVLTLSDSNSDAEGLSTPLTDQLPAGMTVNGNASTTCGGAVTATTGSSTVTLTGGSIPANGSCTVSVDVVVDCMCSYYDSVPAGALQTADGNNQDPAVATLTVGKAILTVLPVPQNNASQINVGYGNATPTLSFFYGITGFVDGDTIAVVSGQPALSVAFGSSTPPVGAYPFTIGVGTLSAANYAFVTKNGTIYVAPASIIVKPNSTTTKYGTAPSLSYAVSGLKYGQTSSVFSSMPTLATTATTTSPVGSYPISVNINGITAPNYTLVAGANGTLTVKPVNLQVKALSNSKIYGAALPTLNYAISGYVNGENASVVSGTPAITTTATTGSAAGTYPIKAAVNGMSAANYTFSPGTNAVLTVFPAVLTVTAQPVSVAKGSPIPALTYKVTGFVNGDTSAILTGAPGLSTTAVQGSPAGGYPINISAGTLTAPNYIFKLTGSTLTIH